MSTVVVKTRERSITYVDVERVERENGALTVYSIRGGFSGARYFPRYGPDRWLSYTETVEYEPEPSLAVNDIPCRDRERRPVHASREHVEQWELDILHEQIADLNQRLRKAELELAKCRKVTIPEGFYNRND